MAKRATKAPKKTPRKTSKKASRKVAKSAPSRRRRFVLWCLKWAAVAAVWATIAVIGIVGWYAMDLPDVDEALSGTRRPSVTLLAADGSSLASYGDLYGVPVTMKDLPPALPRAFVAIEDRRFYDHFGVDLIGLTRAMAVNLWNRRIVQGGSTITQQVAKNLFLTPARTIKRKVQEVLLALWLERKLTKDQILTLYLNRVYFGAGAYGVDAAARRFFGHSAREVSVYEAAMLAGLVKAPSRLNPLNDPKAADARARVVLGAMVGADFLSSAQANAARSGKRRIGMVRSGRTGRYFADWVIGLLPGFVTPGDRDLVVRTTLDPAMQRMAEKAVRAELDGPGRKAGASQAALVAMTPDGAVRALVGGHDYAGSQFNRATQALRQPGSAFKPVVYLAGLEAGLAPESRLDDAPITIGGWSPSNFNGRYRGVVTLREALALSLNTVAVRVAEKAGPRTVVKVARRLGITSDLPADASLALGTGEVTPLELTAAYAPFANGGAGVFAHAITEIRDSGGHVLYARSGSGPGRIVKPGRVAAMNAMMRAVIDEGTGRKAALDRPAAGKTGTSQNFRDAWFVGYTADLVTGVWVGNDDGTPMKKVTGGGLPAELWKSFMLQAHRGLSARALPGGNTPDAPQESLWNAVRSLFSEDAG